MNCTEIDVKNIIELAIGAFLGFLFALFSAWITAVIAKLIKIHRLRKRVYLELAEVYFDIILTENNETLLYYDYPIWDSVIASAILLDIGDNSFIQSLVQIYERLKILKGLELKELSKNENQNPNEDILYKRKNLAKIIANSEHFKYISKLENKVNKKKD